MFGDGVAGSRRKASRWHRHLGGGACPGGSRPKWVRRYQEESKAGLEDRSSRPRCSPMRMPSSRHHRAHLGEPAPGREVGIAFRRGSFRRLRRLRPPERNTCRTGSPVIPLVRNVLVQLPRDPQRRQHRPRLGAQPAPLPATYPSRDQGPAHLLTEEAGSIVAESKGEAFMRLILG